MNAQAPASGPTYPVGRVIQENLKSLKDNWFWFAVLGIALIVLGIVAASYSFIATIATAVVFGYFLLIGGVFHLAGLFFSRGWGGFFQGLLVGVLHLAAGFIIVNNPAEVVILYTLLLAVFFFVEGLFRIFAALFGQFRHWGIVLLNGLVTLLLGVLIWRQWPLSGLWVVGLFVGINLIASGASYLSLAINVKNLEA